MSQGCCLLISCLEAHEAQMVLVDILGNPQASWVDVRWMDQFTEFVLPLS